MNSVGMKNLNVHINEADLATSPLDEVLYLLFFSDG